eukprot:gene2317-21062_t
MPPRAAALLLARAAAADFGEWKAAHRVAYRSAEEEAYPGARTRRGAAAR